jgi:hypothetical protein
MLTRLYLFITLIVCIAGPFNLSFAQEDEDINFFCKNDCIERGGTIGKCNALCSTKNDKGEMTKDARCMVNCMGRTEDTAYHCYSLCDTAGNTVGNGIPEQPSNNSETDKKN